jgi:predicted DNA-binding transcriptional regulator YafY
MSPPTGRVFALLELLQTCPGATAAELAGRLSIDERTVRRYAAHLSELGIPVQARRGRRGGLQLAPGYRLPPLMLTNAEAAAVVVGLTAAVAVEGVPGDGAQRQAGLTALAKIRRMLPVTIAARVDAALVGAAAGAAEGTAAGVAVRADARAAVRADAE